MVDQLQETQTAEPIVDLTSDQGCNRSIRSMSSRHDESDEQVNQNTSARVYMKIVRDHIAEQIWTDKRHASPTGYLLLIKQYNETKPTGYHVSIDDVFPSLQITTCNIEKQN
ncbi:hypothetical protein YC2023_082313 [Brassica napus]